MTRLRSIFNCMYMIGSRLIKLVISRCRYYTIKSKIQASPKYKPPDNKSYVSPVHTAISFLSYFLLALSIDC